MGRAGVVTKGAPLNVELQPVVAGDPSDDRVVSLARDLLLVN